MGKTDGMQRKVGDLWCNLPYFVFLTVSKCAILQAKLQHFNRAIFAAETKPVEQIDDGDKKDESKSAKKKKAKKEKSSKEAKEAQEQSDGAEINKIPEEATGVELEEDAAAVDVKERIKKVASMKKKKSNKDTDSAAKAAAAEAAARSARLAAAKKKEKNHYNQQPVR